MGTESKPDPTKDEIAAWVLKKLGHDDYHFTTAGHEGHWELTIWQWEEDFELPLKPEEVKQLASQVLNPEWLSGFGEAGGDEALRKVLRATSLGRHLKDMRLQLGPREAAVAESYLYREHPKAMRDAITSEFLRELSDTLPKMVNRVEQLRSLPTDMIAPKGVQTYLEEASKCFICGCFISCLIVCRSAIEFALRDRLKMEDTIEKLIGYGRDKFHFTLKPTLDIADEVRVAANRAVHDGVPPAEICKEMFDKTRGVLKELYSEQDLWRPFGRTSIG